MSVNRKTLSIKSYSSKKKKLPVDKAQEVLLRLGLQTFWTAPLDLSDMLDISTWSLENQPPLEAKHLPRTFLQGLWLLNHQARSPYFLGCSDAPTDTPEGETLQGLSKAESTSVNPLDLVMAVYMSASSLLQQEMTVRMVQCHFAFPLVLPVMGPARYPKPCFLLWPLRAVVGQWKSYVSLGEKKLQEGDLASTEMPLVSCIKLGHCRASKSLVLSHLVRGPRGQSEVFLHRGMEGGLQPRRLANGLVELDWVLPSGDPSLDVFPEPLAVANLRGDAAIHEMQLTFLCRVSSAVVVFCGNLGLKERQLLASWKGLASQLILINMADSVEVEGDTVADVGLAGEKVMEGLGLPEGAVLSGWGVTESELADKLREALNNLLRDRLKCTTLEAVGRVAEDLGMCVDEGVVCRKASALAEEVLKGLEEEGLALYRQKQLPLQGPLWKKLAGLEKEESRQKGAGEGISQQLLMEKQDLRNNLGSYKMTEAMRVFTDSLSTADQLERAYFLSWMKLRLVAKQRGQHPNLRHVSKLENRPIRREEGLYEEIMMGINQELYNDDDEDHLKTYSSEKKVKQEEKMQIEEGLSNGQVDKGVSENGSVEVSEKMDNSGNRHETELNERRKMDSSEDENMDTIPEAFPFTLGLEHFLREMGLIFELTHSSPSSGTHNVLRLPSVAADLLLQGVPLEILDGDASNVPCQWLSSVLDELNRRLSKDGVRVRALTSLGVQEPRNAEVFSAVFGVNFPQRPKELQCPRGVYLLGLRLPDNLRKDMECDLLLMMDVQGLCAPGLADDGERLVHYNEMATFVTGLSDVILLNLPPDKVEGKNPSLLVMVNALLLSKRSGTMPVSQVLTQGVGTDTKQQSLQLSQVIQILETEAEENGTLPVPEKNVEKENNNDTKHQNKKMNGPSVLLIGSWQSSSLTATVGADYSSSVLHLKQSIFQALGRSAKSKALGLPEFKAHMCTVWNVVKAEDFAIRFQNTEVAEAFCLLCSELSLWEGVLQEHMEVWFSGAQQRILACKASALEQGELDDTLGELKEEARSKVKSEVDKIRTRLEQYLRKDDLHRDYIYTYRANFTMDPLQEKVTNEIIMKLESAQENHDSTTQIMTFQNIMEVEQEAKIHSLVESCKINNILLQDNQLEEEFEGIWTKALSNFDFRPSENKDIPARVIELLTNNLISRGLHKHLKKVEAICTEKPETFIVNDEYFGYRCRLKHMFEENNKLQRLEANNLASKIVKEYNDFVAEKNTLFSYFSVSYITEVLNNIDKAMKTKAIEIRSAFEVDLKVYLCQQACHDFQDMHAKDRNLLGHLNSQKDQHLATFIYQFRKRDQAWRLAHAFTDMVFRPAALNYIYSPLGECVLEEMMSGDDGQQYKSPQSFNLRLLEELLEEDCFESFLEYILSYDSFCLKRLQARVQAHLSRSAILEEWWQRRLGEVVGKMALAVSQTSDVFGRGLSDTKLLLEKVCLTLEADGEVEVSREGLEGPLFHITTNWDRFVTCLMEAVAEMRLALSQEFSKTIKVVQFLQALPVPPHDRLLHRVRGCQEQCPFCRAPCEMGVDEHTVHRTPLHRPEGLLAYTSNNCLSHSDCPCNMAGDNQVLNKDTQFQTRPSEEHQSLYPEEIIPEEEPDIQAPSPSTYWRYVMARFNSRFAGEFKSEPAQLPQGWDKISRQEALDSLRRIYRAEQC
ncbi:interferon-induced very large GTPase 1 [Osmerus eperlanus]|uniref:interferon-induced very large GTPase 1 n=1 Tax=Osmerus eperlanus TaxID=29151 RepID=UPI002E0FF435